MPRRNWNKVFVTGSTSFVGRQVVASLVEAGADVTVLVRPDHEDRLGVLRRHVRLESGDVWNPASLKGRSRGHGVVVNLVGSIRAQPERGLTFQQLNLASARNAIAMAVSDGVPYFVLLSAVSSPTGVPSEYLRTKREAEEYLRNSGLRWSIVRAPLVFDRNQSTGTLFSMLSLLGRLPPLSLLFGRRAPLSVETAARGIARVALQEELPRDQMIYAGQLRRLGRAKRERPRIRVPHGLPRMHGDDQEADDEIPFGWLPGSPWDDDE
ncbi:MAG TPA: NAD(P)H-binding protein [Aggregatilinea sp.]|jgi:NADH dehydrogenase|uniref:SDR family oxidoreductase n=1 Tax=Aggregatilinea sp. TaxID=2806333 RepID=UPI002D0D9EAD|nr:NAD(P)H-binding protein [Aggregatilinea sp.]HML22750.1 NAD(P)H-binding protein [Aggregatilinea sp.]